MFDATALLLLASGRAARFEDGDKLLAPLRGRPVIAHAIAATDGLDFAARLAVIGTDQAARRAFLADAGFTPVLNADPDAGQGHSLASGVRAAAADARIERVLILLADMPTVSASLLQALADAMQPGVPAVMSEAGAIQSPPALFDRSTFAALSALSGDRGARGVFAQLSGARTVPAPASALIDIDTRCDLQRAEEVCHG